jgi:ribonuclease R
MRALISTVDLLEPGPACPAGWALATPLFKLTTRYQLIYHVSMTYQKEKSLTDDLLSFLGKQSQAVTIYDVRKALGCSQDLAQSSVDALLPGGKVKPTIGGRYFAPSAVQIMRGTISGTDRGFGFATTEDGERHFVPPPQMATLMSGDVVDFFLTVSPKNGKMAAEVIALVSRPETFWLGTVSKSTHGWFFASDEGLNPTFNVDDAGVSFSEGDTIQVRVDAGTPAARTVAAKAILGLGRRGRPGFDIDYSVAKFRIPSSFSSLALEQAQSQALPETIEAGRRNLLDKGFITIDGEDSRDFDDALFALEHDSGFTLFVAIADVSHYVPEDSVLDIEAHERATSVYYPGRVIPMLPEVLSNGLCSLNPGVNRYALVAQLEVSTDGEMTSWEFYPALIQSQGRLTYSGVTAALEGREHPYPSSTLTTIEVLARVHKALRGSRQKKGLLEFKTREPRLVVVDDEIVDIVWRTSSIADELVEDCMLAANRAAAGFLKAKNGAQLYRHHAAPDGKDWDAARETLARFGITLPELSSLGTMISVLESTREDANFPIIEDSLRRSMKPAVYDVAESSHFSLGMAEYTHFTSPIRRYADLLVHRAIKNALAGEPTSVDAYAELVTHCGEMSRRADQATRMVWTLIKRRHLSGLLGTSYEAKALKGSARGLKVVIIEWDCVAFVPAESLLAKGYMWDDAREVWLGQADIESGMRFRVALVLSDEKEVLVELE